MRNRIAAFFSIGFVISFSFCAQSQKNSDRNILKFKDAFESVEDSLVVMKGMMKKLKRAPMVNYRFQGDHNFYVNNTKLARMKLGDSINFLSKLVEISALSEKDALRFLGLVLYLEDNFVTAAYLEEDLDEYFFIYRKTATREYRESRNIIVLTERIKTGVNYPMTFQVLDRKGRIVLLAPGDVKID